MRTSPTRRFRRILCPVDFSSFSRTALRYAAAIADRHGSQLTVVHANDPLLTSALAAAAYDVKLLAARTQVELRAFVRRTLGGDTSAIEILAGYGRPAEEIRRLARKHDIDLVVMGSRGLTNVGKWFYGSTTEETLRSAKVPVLVVPKPKGRSLAPRTLQVWPAGQVLLPIDLDDVSPRDVRAALSVIRSLGATPVLLHVVRASRVPGWLTNDARHVDGPRVERAQERLLAFAKSVGLGKGCQVLFGDPSDQIAMYAATAGAQLVVFTLAKPKSLFGPRQGSITYRVVASGTSPVLALPSTRTR